MGIEFVPLISFVMITTFTPGPNNISSASMGILYGYRKTLNYLFGITAGFFLVMMACAYLSTTLFAILPSAETYLRWIGAGYIMYLAIGILHSSYVVSESDEAPRAFAKGFVLQVFNPKVVIYGLTLYTTFLAPISGRLSCLSISAISFALTAFAATSTWALFGAAIKNKLKNDNFRKIINTSLSLLLVYTAVELSGILSLLGKS